MMDDFKQTPAKQPARKEIPDAGSPGSDEPAFRPPEEIAASEEQAERPPKLAAETAPHHRFSLHWPPSRKEIIVIVAVVILTLGGATSWLLTHRSAPPAAAIPKAAAKTPVPTTVPSTLSGLPVSPDINQRPVTGVMIENSLAARPQSGLAQASVVFEAIAEGGITRFLALYQDQEPTSLGPVRSARPYFLHWALGFDAALAHVGGSPEAMNDIKAWHVKNLDQFFNAGAYHRISSRPAPHNMYTSLAKLRQVETAKGFTSSSFTGFARKADAPVSQPTAGRIDFAISGTLYNVHYTYSPKTNSYLRREGGAVHKDAVTKAQLSPKVVIAIVVPYGLEADNHHSSYGTIGSGKAYIFQDGSVTAGRWQKASRTAQISFTDASGQPVGLNAGQTWISAVGSSSKVSYKP